MKLTGDRREVLRVLASARFVPLYEIMKLNQANFRARISELRHQLGWDIPKPTLEKNRRGNMMSTYRMPAKERQRARKELNK